MKFRIARHVKTLDPMVRFYADLLGLDIKSRFTEQNGYDGIVFCFENIIEIEFTVSDDKPSHCPDEDDLMVFNFDDASKYNAVIERFNQEKYLEFAPKNPYWEAKGKLFRDPDGFNIMVCLKSK